MDFTTVSFLSFLAAVTTAYWACPSRFRTALIAVASYGYYCTWDVKGAFLLLVVTTVAFLVARAIEAAKNGSTRRALILASVSGLILLLTAFKLAPVGSIANQPIWVPLGISYYTFKLVSYVLDVYWSNAAAERGFISFVAYVAFFPQIVGGPIQRSDTFLPQIHRPSSPSWSNVMWGLQRILLGFFKKFLVADILSIGVNFVYGQLHASTTPLILGLYLYPLQIYADFSGLSDIAIGAAWMLGIRTPENFNAPFLAPNPTEFWRRWHMTLTTLLTDYVFTPMRMAVRSLDSIGLVFSLSVTMILIGLWHGPRWTYLVFGVIHATYLAVDALTLRPRKRYYKAHPAAGRLTDWLGPVVTFHLIAVAFVFFRADSVGDAFYMLRHIATGIGAQLSGFSKYIETDGRVILVGLACYAVAEIADYLRRHGRDGDAVGTMPSFGRLAVYSCTTVAVMLMCLLLLGTQLNPTRFVYAMF